MKKIIAIFAVLMLVSLLVMSMFACKKHECTYADTWSYDTESHWHAATCEHIENKIDVAKHVFEKGNECICGAKDISNFVKAIKETNPMSANLTLTEVTQIDGIVLNGSYNVTYNGDGTARVVYEVEQFDDEFISETPITSVTDMVTVNADGTITGNSGLNKGVHIAILLNIDLSNSKIDPKISGDTLNFTVSQEDTAAVLGVAVDSDVLVSINIVSGKILSIGVSYANTTVTALYF